MPPRRGEVWLFDLGMTANTRPVLIVSVEYGDQDRTIVTVVPHTTELRQSRFEIAAKAPFLRPGAFPAQGVSSYPKAWAIRKLGALQTAQWKLLPMDWPPGSVSLAAKDLTSGVV